MMKIQMLPFLFYKMYIFYFIVVICCVLVIIWYLSNRRKSRSHSTKTIESFPIKLVLIRSPRLRTNARRVIESVCRVINRQLKFNVFNENAEFADKRSEISEESIIHVFFEGKEEHRGHGKFDGPRGVLAHAAMDGDELCFDTDENWSDKRLSCVAIHELLHNLGVDHNDRPDSVMNSNYKGREELGASDIKELYEMFPFMVPHT